MSDSEPEEARRRATPKASAPARPNHALNIYFTTFILYGAKKNLENQQYKDNQAKIKMKKD
jgi:hypothetical protein